MSFLDDTFRERTLRQALASAETRLAVVTADRNRLNLVRVAAADLLADDDCKPEWPDCVCSWCVRRRALRDALAAADGTPA